MDSVLYENYSYKLLCLFFTERNYSSARQHFAHGQEGELYGAFLVEHHVTSGYPGEIDLFVTQAVLQ